MNRFGLVVLLAVLCVLVGCPKDETKLPEDNLAPAETVLVIAGDVAPGFERGEFDRTIAVIEEPAAALDAPAAAGAA